MTDTKQDVEAVPISPTAAVHQGCSVGSKQDEVSKPQINDAFKHITDGVQEDVKAVPTSPTSAVQQGCSVGSKPNEVSKPQINDAFKHMTDTKQDVKAVPTSPTSAVQQGCSVGSKQDEVSKPQINDAFKHMTVPQQDVYEQFAENLLASVFPQGLAAASKHVHDRDSSTATGEVVKLTEDQHRLLKTLFKTNIAIRRELQKDECEKVSRKHEALQNLTWKKN
ncbi:uncharacterized protein LOC127878197 isoform X3 [Dreissena polymorpha]|uniref:uncharacterized protein LOC127878197 isoform X3 n=1 Tax=Dreissena polymorpha TaxID=45954 RepID=UPI0022650D50|nr:uncharacterized protein LOC127878197 isoform X3 [Dreissena polymorpha]